MLPQVMQHLDKLRAERPAPSSTLQQTGEESTQIPGLQTSFLKHTLKDDDRIFTPRDANTKQSADETPHQDKTPYPSPSERTAYTESTVFDTPQGLDSPQKESRGASGSPPQPDMPIQGGAENEDDR